MFCDDVKTFFQEISGFLMVIYYFSKLNICRVSRKLGCKNYDLAFTDWGNVLSFESLLIVLKNESTRHLLDLNLNVLFTLVDYPTRIDHSTG